MLSQDLYSPVTILEPLGSRGPHLQQQPACLPIVLPGTGEQTLLLLTTVTGQERGWAWRPGPLTLYMRHIPCLEAFIFLSVLARKAPLIFQNFSKFSLIFTFLTSRAHRSLSRKFPFFQRGIYLCYDIIPSFSSYASLIRSSYLIFLMKQSKALRYIILTYFMLSLCSPKV